jgi:hypothetical protein
MTDFDPDVYLESSSTAAFDPDAHLDRAVPTVAQPPPAKTVRDVEAMHDVMSQDPGEIGQGPNGYNWGGVGRAAVGAATNLAGIIPVVGGGIAERIKKATAPVQPRDVGEEISAASMDSVLPVLGLAAGMASRVPHGANLSAEEIAANQGAAQSMGAAGSGPDLSRVSPELKEAVQTAAQKSGGTVNPDALTRHAQAESLPVPIKLTAGQALQDPTLLSAEQNLRAKHPQFAERFNEQNKGLVENLHALREDVGPSVFSANTVEHGDTLIKAYQDKAAAADAAISSKYQALRDAAGGEFPVSAPKLLENVRRQLNDQLLLDHAPKSVMTTLGRLADEDNMTFQNYESLRTNLARTMRSSLDGNERAAAGVIRGAMEELPLSPGAANLKPLADQARSAARAQFQALEADPAYKAAVTERIAPDHFIRRFITGPSATRDGVAIMQENLSHDPVATQTMGVATLDHLRKSAGIDELGNGNFTQAGFNKSLQALGPRLPSLLKPQTIETLENLGDVARHTQFQPRGSSVNNSNTFVAQAANFGKGALEGAVNTAAKGIPVGSWVRKGLEKSAEKKLVEKSLAPGAGLDVVPAQ